MFQGAIKKWLGFLRQELFYRPTRIFTATLQNRIKFYRSNKGYFA